MESKINLDNIKKTVKEFFKKTTFEVELELKNPEENTIQVVLKMEEPQILIGQGGETLSDIQYLLKMILYKKIKEPIFIDLDINEYKKKKSEYLRQLARELADEVSLTKEERMLPPMSAYERRIIHAELSSRSDIKTESVGEEPGRRVVIKFRQNPSIFENW